jgi:hypothetical protein
MIFNIIICNDSKLEKKGVGNSEYKNFTKTL